MPEWSSPYSGWLYVAVAAGIVVLVALARRTAISDRLRSWLLFVPRLAVFTLLVLILLNPVRRHELRLPAQPAQVDFLMDVSRSMAFDQPNTRTAHVQAALAGMNNWLTGPDRPRVQLYRFGEQLSSASDLAALQPRDDASRLAAALEQLPMRFSRVPPRAVVVFSDGAIDDAERLAEIAEGYRRMHVPIHVYPVGGTQLRGDVAIDELVLPPRTDAGAKVTLHGALRGTGFEGERVVVQVKAADRPNIPPLATLPVTLGDKPQPFEMVVEVNDDYSELILEVPPLAGEVSTQNNRVPFQLAARSRKLKVIYMEGTASNEYRWVRDALQEDKDIECLAMVADQQYVQRPRLLRVDDNYRGFPATREELLQYDCVICSDISIGAFTREQLDWTVELVAQRGGGFAMVGGITSFGAGHWDQTVWDQLIPIDMAGGNLGRGWLYHQFNVKIPDEAQTHPIWRIVEDPEQNRRVLAAMPPFLGANYMQRLKPAATALGYSATPIPNINAVMPVFAAQPYGRGRTFAFAPDTTADWGRLFESQWGEISSQRSQNRPAPNLPDSPQAGSRDNRYFRRFWRNLVRWLSENSTAGNKRLQVETDRVIYHTGEPITITARAYDEKLRETIAYDLVAQVNSAVPPPQKGASSKETDPKNAATKSATDKVSLTPAASGKSYTGEMDSQALAAPTHGSGNESLVLPTREIEVVARHDGKEVARAMTKVQILPDLHELADPRPRPEILEKLAQDAGGTVLRFPGDVEYLLSQMRATAGDSVPTRQPLWDSALLWLLILGLLSVEWSLRRRAGYG
ncbi:MAG: glutamine amidotransferase [Deltaproteobacteria bacterium]